jgi:hypothetical protein
LFGGVNRDDPSTIIACPDSGYAVLSSYQSKPNSGNLWLLRLNNKGDTLWTRFYGDSTKNETPVSLHLLPDGFMIVGSIQMTNTDRSVWLIKCNSKGAISGSKIFSKKNTYASCMTHDSAIVITGQSEKKLFLMKIDSNGDSLFFKSFGDTSENAIGYSVIQTSDSGFAVAGQSKINKSNGSMCLFRFDQAGDTIWTKRIGNATGDVGNDLLQLSDNSLIIAGSRIINNAGNPKSYVQLISPVGTTVWEKSFGTDLCTENIQKILILKNELICAVGTKLGSSNSEISLRMLNLQGSLLFSEEYGNFTGTQQINYFRDYTVTADGNIVIAASTQPVQGGQTFIFELSSDFEKTQAIRRNTITISQAQEIRYFNLLGQRYPSITNQLYKSPLFLIKKDVDNQNEGLLTIKKYNLK